ncbi:hypothetical protein FRUB_08680 [Fimbriiglobus ruber]|uniref:DUF1549 domain-containing protein n=2 Tax=Fimbriiglobus ruber TaxID=1908690 RepID=A0A225DJ25_9BACT|nr:hypothetical protein FRUB_08680 [Fimbriiglobus ruber]
MIVALVVAACTGPVSAAEAVARRSTRPDPAALAAVIDRYVGEKARSADVTPTPLADDATFFRRIHLTLAGRIPTPSAVRLFLADTDPNKRAAAVDKLLASVAYANHMTTTWRGWLLPEASTNAEVAGAVSGFEAWLHNQIRADVPYDQFVAELLTAPLDGRRPASRGRPAADTDEAANPLAFYIAKEAKPENLAAATARLFLGVQLECAQCHDHKFARWTRDQFWGLAAFFGGVERPTAGGGLREILDRRELLIPNSDRAVPATFLDDKEPEWRFKKSPRVTLAAWLTAPDNPFFARAAVNRLWSFAFGIGLVDPVDDAHDQNLPSHPELLDALARAFVDSGFDTKYILRAICRSEAFQRSSALTHPGQRDARLFARFPVQALSPEQIFDSLAVATGAGLEGPGGMYLQNGGPGRREFQEAFALSGRRTESPTTIIQALTLMNGNLVGAATTVSASRTLGAVVTLPGLTPADRITALYMTALGREPSQAERTRSLTHVGTGAEKERYADVFWALLNGAEFRTNH